MNNSKIWLVVKPTVGVPLFLSAVAISSFAVHMAVVSNTTWIADYHSGVEMGAGSDSASLFAPEADPAPALASHTASFAPGQEVILTLPDGTTATAVIKPPTEIASALHYKPVAKQ